MVFSSWTTKLVIETDPLFLKSFPKDLSVLTLQLAMFRFIMGIVIELVELVKVLLNQIVLHGN